MTKTSRGAHDAGHRIFSYLQDCMMDRKSISIDKMAELIDVELVEFLPFLRHIHLCAVRFDIGNACSCGLSALLDRWSVKS